MGARDARAGSDTARSTRRGLDPAIADGSDDGLVARTAANRRRRRDLAPRHGSRRPSRVRSSRRHRSAGRRRHRPRSRWRPASPSRTRRPGSSPTSSTGHPAVSSSPIVVAILGVSTTTITDAGAITEISNPVSSILYALVGMAYFVVSWTGGRRATIGQRIFNIQVGNAFDGRAALARAGDPPVARPRQLDRPVRPRPGPGRAVGCSSSCCGPSSC